MGMEHSRESCAVEEAGGPQNVKLGALRSLLRSYLYSNVTSPTRVHGSNIAIQHNIFQSSRGISVTVVNPCTCRS